MASEAYLGELIADQMKQVCLLRFLHMRAACTDFCKILRQVSHTISLVSKPGVTILCECEQSIGANWSVL